MGETRRATIQEAARILGVSEGAIRKRVKRNTLRHDKDHGGRVYVYLEGDTRGVDEGVDEAPHPDSEALISRLEDEVRFLREELARKDAIMMNMTESMRQLTAPAEEVRESPEGATPQPGRVEPQAPLEEAQEAPEMHMPEAGGGPLPRDRQTPSERPWWRRMFGG